MVPSSSFVEKGGAVMKDVMSLEGPVLKVNGELVLFIPLSAGGEELIELSRGISEVEGEFLKINIPIWLVAVLRIEEGDLVCVRKAGGMFRIGLAEPRQVH
jgi:hypothetical protein